MEWIPIPSKGGNLKVMGVGLPKTMRKLAAKDAPPPTIQNMRVLDQGVRAVLPQPLPPHPVEDTRVSNQQISVALASTIGIGSIFGGSVNFNEVGYWLDAMAYTDQYESEPADGNLVLATRFGFGIRVMFRVQTLNANAKFNFGAIGAAIDAGYASASYEIDSFGLGPGALTIILGDMGQSGPLTSEAFYDLNSVILKNLVDYIKTNLADLQPQRVAALLQSVGNSDSLDISQAILFAMRQIRSGTTLHDALSNAGDLDSTSIRLAYSSILGGVPDTTNPSGQNKQKADDWLALN